MERVLSINFGCDTIKIIYKTLRADDVEINNVNPADIASMEYAPIASCDVDCSLFLHYKNIVTDKGQNLTIQNIHYFLVIYCNNHSENKCLFCHYFILMSDVFDI